MILRQSSISVAVRVRPFTSDEENRLLKVENDLFFTSDGSLASAMDDRKVTMATPRGIRKIVNVVDDKMLIFDPPETDPLSKMQKLAFPKSKPRSREYRFVFDKLFDSDTSQEDVYSATTRPLLNSILDGFNATVFAYGATGCGKTHTILGSQESPGVIFLTMKELFERIDSLADTKIFDVSLSFLEIYNESIRDLLNPETDHKKLVLREDANKKISVTNLLTHKPNGVQDVMDLILQGNQNRTSSPTEANATSSRSHAVLQVNVVQKNRSADLTEQHTFATLSIIDLAGSERAAATQNRGARLNEGANINKSLLALGNCINALCDPRRKNHVPYRNSKLTRLLKFSLGGNCKTVMIVCISPLSRHYDETLNTLKYADRAKEIKTKLIRNQHNLDRHVGSYLKMITEQKQEITELRERELKIIESTVARQTSIHSKCIELIMEMVENVQKSLRNHKQEKWKKYYLLAKRKLLLLYHVDVSLLGDYIDEEIVPHQKNVPKNISSLMFQINQFKNKIDKQIINLEQQYDSASEISNIFNYSTQHTVDRLKELEGWSEHHTTLSKNLIESIQTALDKDILVNSSILFDFLLGEVKHFNFLAQGVADIVAIYSNQEQENTGMKVDKIIDKLISSLELMNNSDFDSAIENYTSAFIQQQFVNSQDDESTDQDMSFADTSMAANSIPNLTKEHTILINHKIRDKRGSSSPLKASPPRSIKKTIIRKPSGPKFGSPQVRRKVRTDSHVSDVSIIESEVSVDESMIASKPEDDSPLNNSILDRMDDLDFKFDPTINSPPVSKVLPDRKPERSKLGARFQSLTSRKLPTSQDSNNTESGMKIPLLNKQASSKILQDQPQGFKLGLLSEPSKVINTFGSLNHETRNISSSGTSNNVDWSSR